jgi:hypothetical protein
MKKKTTETQRTQRFIFIFKNRYIAEIENHGDREKTQEHGDYSDRPKENYVVF